MHNFLHKILGLFEGLFSGDSRGGSGERIFSTTWRARQAFLRLPRADPFLSPPHRQSYLIAEGKHPRNSRGHDRDDCHSRRVDRNDPGRIWQALNQDDSGQMGHGPWEWVPALVRDRLDLTSHRHRCFKAPTQMGDSQSGGDP